MLTLLIAAFALGFVFNATPGPVFAETVRRSVTLPVAFVDTASMSESDIEHGYDTRRAAGE